MNETFTGEEVQLNPLDKALLLEEKGLLYVEDGVPVIKFGIGAHQHKDPVFGLVTFQVTDVHGSIVDGGEVIPVPTSIYPDASGVYYVCRDEVGIGGRLDDDLAQAVTAYMNYQAQLQATQ